MLRACLRAVLVFVLISLCAAQDQTKKQEPAAKESTPAAHEQTKTSYRLDFKIYELEGGKRTNERAFTMIAGVASSWTNLRTGTRVPVVTAPDKSQYIDVGVRLESRLIEQAGKLFAYVRMEISSFALPEQGSDAHGSSMPVLRNASGDVETQITAGKPQVILSVDDVNSKKKIQVELTATRID
jgi:hypothetical protein